MPVSRLKDVAAKAGVSVAAASLALAGKGRLSDEVRARVRSAASELAYRGAGTLSRRPPGRTCVGILHVAERTYEWNFVRPAILELERAMLERGLNPVLLPVHARAHAPSVVRMVADSGVTAVFTVHQADGTVLAGLQERGIVVVVINDGSFQDRFPSVCVDDFQGAYEGTRWLLALGHRSLAFVEYERPESPAVVADRFVGFRKALEEQGVSFPAENRVTVPFMDTARLARNLGTLFAGGRGRPTAVFAHDDYLGLWVVDALRGLGLAVPADVSLVAPGDVVDYTLPFVPQITTMRIDMALLGRIAANLMVERMGSADASVHVLKVKEQLVRRGTCRAV
jgi:LacI family transcriptional regulator